jgi:hypothetical protein
MMEIDDLLNKYFEGNTTVEEENVLRDFFRSEEVPKQLADCKPIFAYFDEEIQKMQGAANIPLKRRRFIYWAAAASILLIIGVGQVYRGVMQTAPCRHASNYVIINGRCYADVEKARTMAFEALLQVATPAEDFFPDNGFFND